MRPKAKTNLSSLKTQGFEIKHGVGIDSGTALIVRGGMRGNNDLVSIGRAPNLAAKLSDIRNGDYRTYITQDVYNVMLDSAKTSSDGRSMWEGPLTREVGGEKITVHKSTWKWAL
ncbi:hypothetical protein [Streptomyces gardneri]|uniref:hypothetical protein n=1 Tax=Streptomyces gardneri TaxID=66892 RepID=UPI0035E223B4